MNILHVFKKVDKKLGEERHETPSGEKYILNEKYTERHYRKYITVLKDITKEIIQIDDREITD